MSPRSVTENITTTNSTFTVRNKNEHFSVPASCTDEGSSQSANPPFEAKLLIVMVSLACLATAPTALADIDDVATVDTLTTPLFEEHVSKATLGWTRLTIAILIFSVSLHRMSTNGHYMMVPYLKQSRLKSLPINLDGLRSQGMFTCWSWNTLGLSFALNGSITLLSAYNEDLEQILPIPLQKILLRLSLLIFEMVAPTTMLVSAIVRYILWPQAMKGKTGTGPFTNTRALIQHNANIIFSLLEVGLFGNIQMRLSDMAVAPFFGMIYIVFTWSMIHRWLPSKEPQFVYFFLP